MTTLLEAPRELEPSRTSAALALGTRAAALGLPLAVLALPLVPGTDRPSPLLGLGMLLPGTLLAAAGWSHGVARATARPLWSPVLALVASAFVLASLLLWKIQLVWLHAGGGSAGLAAASEHVDSLAFLRDIEAAFPVAAATGILAFVRAAVTRRGAPGLVAQMVLAGVLGYVLEPAVALRLVPRSCGGGGFWAASVLSLVAFAGPAFAVLAEHLSKVAGEGRSRS